VRVTEIEIEKLIPYARNSRTHSDEQVAQIAASIREFGFTNPVLIDEENGIIAGHGRVLAARKLDLPKVPTIRLSGLTEIQKRAYIIADNKLALNAGWNEEMLQLELQDLTEQGFDMNLVGFSEDELSQLLSNNYQDGLSDKYTRKIDPPVYTPKGDKPEESELYDRSKAEELLAEIEATPDLPPEVAAFLKHAAERHTVFRFDRIAEYYCHAPEPVQNLMEKSALIIIDFDQAIEGGFVVLSEALMSLAGSDNG
jgi:hypothetical protein